MKNRAFTLIELLVVIAIIGILAAMLMTALAAAKTTALKSRAKTEMQAVVTAIEAYDQTFGKFPVSKEVQDQASVNANNKINPDFTFGGQFGVAPSVQTVQSTGLYRTNAEVIAILMDFTNYPGTTTATANLNHQSNTKQTKFLAANLAPDNTSGGVGSDLVYRDPWGNPYVISMDLNYDNSCNDAFYGAASVSQNPPGTYVQTGFNGLFNPNAIPATPAEKDSFQFHGKIMVWSAGPDGKINSSFPANQNPNKDNILSWQ